MIKFTGITFDPNFAQKAAKNFEQAQKYVDSETLRLSDPYVPMDTGKLKESGTTGTMIGSGVVQYTVPYAREQYYNNSGRGKQGITKRNQHNYKCLRGKMWFERMKADHKQEILEGLKKFKGGFK